MADTTYSSGTTITSAWLNDTNAKVYKDAANVRMPTYGAIGNGITGDAAAIQAAINSGKEVIIPSGTYLIDADLIVPDNAVIYVHKGATLKASANGRIIFKSTTHAYYARIYGANIDGNGKTSVTGFDMVSMRHQAGIYNPYITGCDDGIILRQLCWDTVLMNPHITVTTRPITIKDGSNAVTVFHPALDTYTTGITIVNGPTYDTTDVKIIGGYIQGGTNGITDTSAYSTKIEGTYFELNTVADINLSGSVLSMVVGTGHRSSTGTVAIKGRNCDGVLVTNPSMSSGGRSTGLFDFDATNVNCHAMRVSTAGSQNLPEGVITGIGYVPVEDSGTFTPVIEGSSAAGVGTYTLQSGTWRKIGKQVHVQIAVTWTAHTGTGNILVSGIPTTLVPTSFTPRRVGQCVALLAYTGPTLYSYLNGTSSKLSLVQVATTGVESLVPITAAGTVYINLVYDL